MKTEVTLGLQITDLSKDVKETLTHFKRLEADIAVVRTVNNRLVEGLVKTESQCLKNAQYSWKNTLEIAGIPNSVDNSVLVETMCSVFKKIGVNLKNGMFKSVVAWKKRKGPYPNLLTTKIASKSLGWRRNLNPFTQQSWNFLKTPKFLFMKFYVLITEVSERNLKT